VSQAAFPFLVVTDNLLVASDASLKPVVRYKGFLYQAASWKTARRVVAKEAKTETAPNFYQCKVFLAQDTRYYGFAIGFEVLWRHCACGGQC
jgi:hypothetical protein